MGLYILIGFIVISFLVLLFIESSVKPVSRKNLYISNILFILMFISIIIVIVSLFTFDNKSAKSYDIQRTTYKLQHIDKDSYYDLQGNEILIKVNDEFKTLSIKKCNIKGSKDSPKLIRTQYIIKNKFYRILFNNKTYYTLKVPTK